MIVELCKAANGDMVYVNTDHIVTVRITYGTPEGKNEIRVDLVDGQSHIVTDDVMPDGELGPDGLRVMSMLAPQEFNQKFHVVNTIRARRGIDHE
jgi:hypothetical protein